MIMSIIRKLIHPPRRMVSIAALMVCVFIGVPGRANDITVSSVKRFGQVTGSHWMVRFHVSWMNSWRCDLAGAGQGAPYNYDAAWVFMKYRTNVSGSVWGDWKHASLNTNASDHFAPAGSTIDVGVDGRTGEWGTNGVGVFIYRSANGSNIFAANGTQLRWNYAADGVADSAQVELKVCAIEMVYVPEGAFYAGSATNGTESGRFIEGYGTGTSNNTPFLVQTEGQISVSNEPNCLWGTSQIGDNTIGSEGVLSNAFPKGFRAFYVMKYGVTQAQHVDFLNMLTRNQQATRFLSTNVGDYMENFTATNFPSARNGVQLISDSGGSPNPRVFANNLNTNNAPNSTNDGQWIACNYLNWYDLEAYLDWAGLRPMTELEFEKACRGTNAPVAGEYAWGTNAITQVTNMLNSGTANEAPQPVGANSAYAGAVTLSGPMRVGCLGTNTGDRARTGAGYYGMMELSGNLLTRCITVGSTNGRRFTGQHGNGALNSSGNANVSGWPDYTGAGMRGGDYKSVSTTVRVADRATAAQQGANRNAGYGIRGVRSAP